MLWVFDIEETLLDLSMSDTEPDLGALCPFEGGSTAADFSTDQR